MVSRIGRISLLGLVALALVPAVPANNIYNSNPDSFFDSGFELFYAGPQWLLNALPGSVSDRLAHARVARVPFDRDGDRVESLYRYSNDVGTLANPFNLALFNNVSLFATAGGTGSPKTSAVLAFDANTPYYFAGAGDANWGTNGTWGPGPLVPGTTGFPNGAGDSAMNFQEVSGHVIQDVIGGVTVGIIDNLPTTAGNSAQSVSWTITTDNPITLDSGSPTAAAQINNSQAVGTSSLTINGTTNGLRLVSDVIITNVNPGGLISISAPISDAAVSTPRNVTTVGPGTVVLTGVNTFAGTTTINSGTLNAGGIHTLGATSSVTANSGGTLLFSGATTDRINDVAPINLNGATIQTGGLSEYTASPLSTVLPGMGALTLTSTNTIDLGNFASIISFADSHNETWAGTLRILNWTGTIGTGNGTDQVYFGTDANGLTSSQLNQISFYSDNGTTLLGTAQILGDGEIVPLAAVPEPATWIAGALTLAAILLGVRHRLRPFRA